MAIEILVAMVKGHQTMSFSDDVTYILKNNESISASLKFHSSFTELLVRGNSGFVVFPHFIQITNIMTLSRYFSNVFNYTTEL